MKKERITYLEKQEQEINKLTEVLASEFCAMSLNCKIDKSKCENCTFTKFYLNTAINLYKKGVRVVEADNEIQK